MPYLVDKLASVLIYFHFSPYRVRGERAVTGRCRCIVDSWNQRFPLPTELHLPEKMHAGSLHSQTHNPLSKAPIQLCALSQATTVTRLDTDRKLNDAPAPTCL